MSTLSLLTRRKGDSTYTSFDGRYAVVPNYREARRGGGAQVREGWNLIDTWTDVARWYPTLPDIDRSLIARLLDLDFVRDHAGRFTGWSAATKTSSGIAEVRLYQEGEDGSIILGLVSLKDPETRLLGVAKLLVAVGLEGLREVAR